ncbi:unannotated protein [freshwater metagenome]|uniref:Unannotated protein n=1 Tax=freshwater metagenome TaxID=449393 RepID=A0A6J6IQ99_9ZZZZ
MALFYLFSNDIQAYATQLAGSAHEVANDDLLGQANAFKDLSTSVRGNS